MAEESSAEPWFPFSHDLKSFWRVLCGALGCYTWHNHRIDLLEIPCPEELSVGRSRWSLVPGHTLRAAAPLHEEVKFIISSLDDPGLLDWFYVREIIRAM